MKYRLVENGVVMEGEIRVRMGVVGKCTFCNKIGECEEIVWVDNVRHLKSGERQQFSFSVTDYLCKKCRGLKRLKGKFWLMDE